MTADDPNATNDTTSSILGKARRGGLTFVSIFLLCVSAGATGRGIWTMMAGSGTELSFGDVTLTTIIVVILTGGLGIAAEFLLGSRRHLLRGRAKAGLTVVTAIILFLSVGLAYTAWWENFAARSTSDDEVEASITTVEAALGTTKAQMANTQSALQTLATSSQTISDIERDVGGTCGDRSAAREGPRARLRAGHTNLFASVAASTGVRVATLNEGILSTEAAAKAIRSAGTGDDKARSAAIATFRKALNDVMQKINAIQTDPILKSEAETLSSISKAYSTGTPHSSGVICVDQGIAASLTGVVNSLQGLKPLPSVTFNDYSGNKASFEAFRRFSATMFGWLPVSNLGNGISGLDEVIAFFLAWVVDGFLMVSIWLRGKEASNGSGAVRLKRVLAEQEDRRNNQMADELLADEKAMAHAQATTALRSSDALPFADVLVHWSGQPHLIIPTSATNVSDTAKAQKMIDIAMALDAIPNSGVREQLRMGGAWYSRFQRYDKKARDAFQAISTDSKWGKGRHYRWFRVSSNGLQTLARWVLADQIMSKVGQTASDGPNASDHLAREAKARAGMQGDRLAHQANMAEVKRENLRDAYDAELRAALRTRPKPDEPKGTQPHQGYASTASSNSTNQNQKADSAEDSASSPKATPEAVDSESVEV